MCCFSLHGKCFYFLTVLIPDRKTLLYPSATHLSHSPLNSAQELRNIAFPIKFPGLFLLQYLCSQKILLKGKYQFQLSLHITLFCVLPFAYP